MSKQGPYPYPDGFMLVGMAVGMYSSEHVTLLSAVLGAITCWGIDSFILGRKR